MVESRMGQPSFAYRITDRGCHTGLNPGRRSGELHDVTSPHSVAGQSGSCHALPYALVVDDDPLFRKLLIGMLKDDYRVICARDGQDGFDKALSYSPAVAVVDVQMPNWDGLKLLSSLREHELLRNVAVVMLSSDASRETVLAAIHAGADDYVIKSALSRGGLLAKLMRARQPRNGASIGQTSADHFIEAAHRSAAPAGHISVAMSNRTQELIDAWE